MTSGRQTCYGKEAMPIERKSYNLRALNASLRSDLPTMRAEAEKVIAKAIAEHETLTDAGNSLGIPYGSFVRLRKALSPPEKPAKRKR
jgi:hypothetical protein